MKISKSEDEQKFYKLGDLMSGSCCIYDNKTWIITCLKYSEVGYSSITHRGLVNLENGDFERVLLSTHVEPLPAAVVITHA